MDVEQSFLGTAKEEEVGANEVSWLRKEDLQVHEDSSAEGAVHQRRQPLLENENVLTNSFGWVVETCSLNG